MRINKAIILAAGLGTRFFPATKSIAKEMLPIVDKPCVQYLVEEAVASGIKEIIFIVNKSEKSIQEYFGTSEYLYSQLKKKKKFHEIEALKKIEKLAKFKFVIQNNQLGDGHAILCAKKEIGKKPFAVLFGDDIYDYKIPPLKQLIQQYKKLKAPIIALEKIDKKDCKKYGMVELGSKKGQTYKIQTLVEKPLKAPSAFAIAGKYIITPELYRALEKSSPGRDFELRLIDGMKTFIKHSPIYGCLIKGLRFDTGDKLGYIKAVIHFSLKNKNFKSSLKNFIRGY